MILIYITFDSLDEVRATDRGLFGRGGGKEAPELGETGIFAAISILLSLG